MTRRSRPANLRFGQPIAPDAGLIARNLTPQMAARRAWLVRQSKADAPGALCPSYNLTLPVSGICDNCA